MRCDTNDTYNAVAAGLLLLVDLDFF